MKNAPSDFGNLFDGYNRQARLYPSLLSIIPLLLAIFSIFPELIGSHIAASIVTITSSCGILYFMSTVARTRGKKIETRLLKEWGGWPTTHLLRHSGGLDVHTRSRYHKFLEGQIVNLKFPSSDEEKNRPSDADLVYESAIKWLKEQTRGKEFSILLHENAHYGFRRNMRGMRLIGIIVNLIAFFALLSFDISRYCTIDIASMKIILVDTIRIFGHDNMLILGAMALNVFFIFVWIVLVTDEWVKEAAAQYASSLLASIDQLPDHVKGRKGSGRQKGVD